MRSSSAIDIPDWVQIVAYAPTLVMCVMLVAYLLKKVQCEKFVEVAIVAHVIACLVVLAWVFGSGSYKAASR